MSCQCCHSSTPNCVGSTKTHYLPIIFSLLLLIAGIVCNYFSLLSNDWITSAAYAVAFLLVGWPVLREAIRRIVRGDFFNEFTLMSIATLGAFCIGEYAEGVAVMLFYSVGEIFQERAQGKAQRNIKALLDVRPETATVLRNGTAQTVHPEEVSLDETIEVKVGQRVPLDGKLLNGKATFNTGALTGESLPRTLYKSDTVLAGMIPTNCVIQLTVSKPYNESALARILTLVQEANERKAPAELFIRRFARIYTPAVAGLALAIILLPFFYSLIVPGWVYLFNDWLYRGLVFLVISCPCALVISIPLGYFGGIGAASRAGILFKGGNYLDAITRINTVVFDKTGTLTKGVFEVQELINTAEFPAKTTLGYLAAAESYSTHPIARAISQYALQREVIVPIATDITEIPGYGLKAQINGTEVLVGSPRLLKQYDIEFAPQLDAQTHTIVVCAIDGRYAGHLLLSDTQKVDASIAIEELKALNINNIQLLSGDKQAIVSKLGENLGIVHTYGDLLPEDKVAHIEILKADPSCRIAFVGDGINDAPVLAACHIGIAMGGLGSDAAIETADVVIQNDQPSKVATAIRIARATRCIVYQNITLAFGVKLAVLVLGATGMATLWEAVFADVGVALLAILNAIRLQKKKTF